MERSFFLTSPCKKHLKSLVAREKHAAVPPGANGEAMGHVLDADTCAWEPPVGIRQRREMADCVTTHTGTLSSAGLVLTAKIKMQKSKKKQVMGKHRARSNVLH